MRAATLVTAAAAVVIATAAIAAPRAPAGSVTFLAGEATRASGERVDKLAAGSPVHEGDVLETGRRTRLEVRLADRSVVRLGPGSRVVLESAAFGETGDARDVSARLVVGKVWANVAKAVGGEARFEVQTRNAVAGVRGTTFRVDAATDESVVVKVYSGTVAVASAAVPRPAHDGGKPERRRIAGPQQVTREQWERIVTSMMEVRVSAEGVPSQPEAFALAPAGQDEWEQWNRARDGQR